MTTYQCTVHGKVQGVYYRASVHEMASEAGFDGYVMNLTNGAVEACVSLDDEKKLAYFLGILREGSAYSHVDKIDTRKITHQLKKGFYIYS